MPGAPSVRAGAGVAGRELTARDNRPTIRPQPAGTVVDRVSRRPLLRAGPAVVGLWNEAFDLDGTPRGDGTTVPGVQRVLMADTTAADWGSSERRRDALLIDMTAWRASRHFVLGRWHLGRRQLDLSACAARQTGLARRRAATSRMPGRLRAG
jgi:hypothetical protein